MGAGVLAWLVLGQAAWAEPTADELDARVETLHGEGKYAEAEALARRSLEMREAALGLDHPAVATSLDNVARLLKGQGDYAGARPLYERSLAIREEALGPDHPDVAQSLNRLGVLLVSRGDRAGARPLYERSLAIREEALGPNHRDVAVSLNNLAGLVESEGDLAGARSLYERSLAIFERALGPDHPDVAVSLNNLAVLLKSQADFAGARPLLKRSLAIREESLGPDHPAVATGLNNLALLLESEGDHAGARPLYERSLAIRESALGPDHPVVSVSLNNLAGLLESEGDYAGARPLYERSLAIRESALGPDHPAVATGLNNLAVLLVSLGDYAGARPLYERSLAIREEALGPDHPDVAQSLNGFAVLLRSQGLYAGARALYERSLVIREAALGPDHPDVANSLNNLALLLKSQGDYAGALAMYERSLAIFEGALGSDHPDVATSLNNLAGLLESRGDYAGARPLHERGLAIREAALGPDHPDVADSLNNLALLLALQGDPVGAGPLFERSLAIWEEALGPDHPDVAASLNNLAGLLASRADYAGARALHDRSLAIKEEALGQDHPHVATSLDNIAALLASEGDPDAARPFHERSLAIREARLDLLDTLSEREALAYVAASRASFDGWLRAFDAPSDAAHAWSTTLRWKGVATRHLRDRLAGEALQDPAVRDLHQRLRATRASLARLTFADYDAGHAAARRARQLELTGQKEQLERDLAAASAAWRGERAIQQAGAREVCGALSDGTALVDFLRSGDAYIAFATVAPACEVHRVDLGGAVPLDEAVAAWRAALAPLDASRNTEPLVEGEAGDERQRAEAVAERLWAPLQPIVGDAAQLVVIPDGSLSAVPFGALPAGDGYLLERVPVAILSHAQDLLRAPVERPRSGALLVGAVDFGQTDPALPAPPRQVATRSAPCADGSYRPLPWTGAEVEAIASLWSRSGHRKEALQVLTSTSASESAVSGALAGHRVVHLATHGFFATGRCKNALAGGGDVEGFGGEQTVVGHHPMLLSGLVLAGANAARDALAPEDGILTAEEVAGVDLRGTELVVLSACETGLGEVRSGEGVLGLQRAFSLAGARSLVMSLWAVPDEATSELMQGFYARVLHRRRPSEATVALREAQLEMMRRNRERFGAGRPESWAAFVVSGVPAWGRAGS